MNLQGKYEGINVHLDPVSLLQFHEDILPDHAVLVVVDVVLVKQRRHLNTVSPYGCQGLLHIIGAQMDSEHVAA